MSFDMPDRIKKLYLKLGFKLTNNGYWHAEFRINENEHVSVDFSGCVYVHKGFNRYGDDYSPICVKSFEATTPAQIEVLVKPLLYKS